LAEESVEAIAVESARATERVTVAEGGRPQENAFSATETWCANESSEVI